MVVPFLLMLLLALLRYFTKTYNQSSLRAGDTLQSKHSFENLGRQYGIQIKEFYGDNGIFKSKDWIDDCDTKEQTNIYCGVGTHHQNGIAERSIGTITRWSRCMILHADLHWPQQSNVKLWPLAMDYAVWLWNMIPHWKSDYSPLELFT